MLALHVASAIRAGVDNNTIFQFDNKSGTAPPVPPGETGEFIQSESGTTILPPGYDYVVDSAHDATILGNGDRNEQVLAGSGNLKFFASSGSGSIITGGGNDQVNIAASDAGDWLIAMGNGNDTIRALGSGSDTISAVSGKTLIQLGSGSDVITTAGSNTILGGTGSETIVASGSGKQVIFGNASDLFFIAAGASTVIGGTGSDTVFGGSGDELLEGGTKGGNFLQAGDGRATLFGGGNGDQLYAAGDDKQELHAASGNETLSGAFASGHDTFFGGSGSDQIFGGFGHNTFVAGTGSATVTASPGSMNLFDFMKAVGGGSELVMGLTDVSQVHIDLVGYGENEVKFALDHQSVSDGSVTVTLSDHTTVTFQNVGLLSNRNFDVGGSGDSDGDHGKHLAFGNHGDH
jgi:Ca2+-binding RTX toxin-like protein